MFSRYILFELKRLLKMPKNIVVLIVFALGIFVFYGFNLVQHEATYGARVAELDEERQMYIAEIKYYRRLSETMTGEVIFNLLNADYRQLSRQYMAAKRGIDLGEAEQWRNELAAIIRRDEVVLIGLLDLERLSNQEVEEEFSTEYLLPLRYRNLSKDFLVANIKKYRYIENTELYPVFFDYDMTNWQFLLRLIHIFGRVAIPFFVVLLTGDAFSSERDTGSYKFLLLQPLSRAKVYLAKYAASLLMCFGVIILFKSLLFGINGAFNGMGEGGYPVRFVYSGEPLRLLPYDEEGNLLLSNLDPGTVMPSGFVAISEYIMWSFLLILFYLAFLIAFVALISIFADNSISALAVSTGIVLASMLISDFLPQGDFMWNPLEYIDIYNLANGNFGNFVWYPLVWALGVGVVGMIYFSRKDIIC